ncbi:MAG: hypothetical protein BYD32DRAFT_435377 [Podila humilis]|nr:MAG: hypothetical protein BYD32DRAFT_435377 [Podila humilis]
MTVLERATINKALNLYAHHIGDVGVEIALPGRAKNGWKKYCKLFCDNVIFWALVDTGGDVEKQRKNSISAILEALEEQDVNRSMVKIVRQGKISFDGFFHDRTVKKFAKKASGDVEYISIKVTLHSIKLSTLLTTLHDAIVELENNYIFLHDVDIATDCHRVTSRPILHEYLEKIFGDELEIVNDRSRVGDHCLSWIAATDDDQKVRCKVYNKFVQMMESAEVMSSLGSRMESLVISTIDEKLHKRLRKARKTGLSRLEVKFYGGDLYDHAYYENYLEQVKEIIQECPTYEVPFAEYWKYMASKITSMVAVFASGVDRSAFAYCHWRNSITAKKYGTMREKVGRDEALKLLANYSFNDRPIYLVEVSLDDPSKEIVVTKYSRPDGCTMMTLVAGCQNGLYPYAYHEDIYEFASMGIVSTNNITINWPETRLRKSSPPLVDIHQVAMDGEDLYMQTTTLVGTKTSYKIGHGILDEHTKYTVIAAMWQKFGNQDHEMVG